MIAGINATLKNQNKEPLILKRDEAYIGVMIDDLVTKMEMVIKSNRTQLIEDCRISRQNNLERLQIDTWCKKVLDSYLLL